jgi:hypothetical protein
VATPRGRRVKTKVCTQCRQRKRITSFYNFCRSHDGKTAECKRCRKARMAARYKAASTKLRAKSRYRRWSRPKHIRDQVRFRIYGLTSAQFKALSRNQKHSCAICRKRRQLQVDHCHKTGMVRMLLCQECNLGIGKLKDDPKLLERAAKLLRDPPAARILAA